jgi:hypothetical protein
MTIERGPAGALAFFLRAIAADPEPIVCRDTGYSTGSKARRTTWDELGIAVESNSLDLARFRPQSSPHVL